MITPRRTQLVRVPDLHAFRQAIIACSTDGDPGPQEPTAIVVPTRAAAHHLRRNFTTSPSLPLIVTRAELYLLFNARLDEPLGLLTGSEREVILRSAAAEAAAAGAAPPFRLRPGLVAEMLRFYDQLRRQRQSVDRYEELLVESLDADSDRGAERLLRQTRFMAASFRAYERLVAASPGVDEHGLRAHLILREPVRPLRRVVVAVGDWIADPDGLFAADFDLLTRVPGLGRIDVVATSGVLQSGFDQRLHDWLPGLGEVDGGAAGPTGSPVPHLLTPDGEDAPHVWMHRDREEELVAIARRAAGDLDRIGVVFARPLPYLYLAPGVFSSGRVPYQAVDTLPLAAEPAAAGLDLIIEFVSSQFTRPSALALLQSPQLVLGTGLTRHELAALDRAMHEGRYLGEMDALRAFAAGVSGDASNAAVVVVDAAEALQPLTSAAPASAQLTLLASFLHRRMPARTPARVRFARVRRSSTSSTRWRPRTGCTATTLRRSTIWRPDIRRSIEEQTFDRHTGEEGIHLLDAQAARFGAFETLAIVGMIEGEWPERARRNIFYSPGVLAALGWPSERDRRSASVSAFVDLLRSAVPAGDRVGVPVRR